MATDTAVDKAILRSKIYAMPLDKIVGQPTAATVNHLKEQIAKIAALIKTTKWGSRHMHLPLVFTNKEYQTALSHDTTLPDRTANNKGCQPQSPLIPTGLTINTTHINFKTVNRIQGTVAYMRPLK